MKQQAIPITGGLDLVGDKISAPAGSAQWMMNYEVANTRGIRRVDGFSRWDGRRNFASTDVAIYAYSDVDANATGWTLGASVTVTYTNYVTGDATDVPAIVIAVSNDVADANGGGPGIPTYTHSVTAIFTTPPLGFISGSQVTDVTGYGWTGSPLQVSLVSAGSSYSYYSALIQALPGDSKTRIPGLHFFNDKLYAVVDLVALEVTPVEGTLLEGASLYCASQTAPIGTIALTRPSATAGRTIVELFDYTSGVSLSGTLYTPYVTSELCPNGTFASGTSWTTGTGWAIAAGVASISAAATGNLTSTLLAVAGYAYEITYTVTARSAGSVTVTFGGATGTARSATGTYTETLITSSAAALVFAGTTATLSIDNVSVRIVSTSIVPNGTFASGANWGAGTNWAIGAGVATATESSGTLTSSLTATSGKRYRIVYTVTRSAGSVTVSFGGATGTARSAAGTYVDFLTASNTNALVFTGSSFSGTIDNVSVYVVAGLATYVGQAEPERAALYYASWDSAGGWTRQPLGRLAQYVESSSDASAFFLPYAPSGFISQISATEIKDTGWIGADSWEELGGGAGWTGGQSDLTNNDGTTVGSAAGSAGLAWWTTLLSAQFSADVLSIPAGAIVRGIEVSIFRYASHVNVCSDRVVTIGKTGGYVGANKASTTTLPITTATEATYGASNDLWQLALNPSDINDGGFNVQVSFNQLGNTPAPNVLLDQIRVKVYYQEQNRKAYVYDSTKVPTDQEVEILHYTITEGTSTGGTNGDRKGLIVLNPTITSVDAEKVWQFAPGQQIRTQAAGAGALLANLASDDEPITLPSSYSIATEDARYTFSSARPYARDATDVFFVCSGAECAYMYADGYALPIQTGLMEQFEKPRHAMWSGSYLALGYATGTLSISDTGNPLTFADAASTAAEIGASDRVTGLLKLKGDSLGVFTENTIFALQGQNTTASPLQRIDISPDSGAIEYTVCNAGMPMFCDYRGIATLQTTADYGDFNRPGISWAATPWLIERLQSDRRNQTVDKTVIAAYPSRQKGQYRVLFNDGWQASLTVQGADNQPQITTQRLYGDWQDRDVSAIRVLGLTTGVTSTGQDLAFMSFDLDPESSRYRYVFQLDAGRSYDGEEIIAQWMSQPLMFGAPFFAKTFEQLGLIGRAYGYADLKVFAATDFTDPVSDETTSASTSGYDMAFGTTASSTEGNYKCIKTIRGEGEDITYLFESISATELPHTIQAMVVRYETTEPKR